MISFSSREKEKLRSSSVEESMEMRVLGVETFRASCCNSSSAHTIISHNPISFSFLIPNTTHKFLKTNFPSISLYSNDAFSQGRSGFCVKAKKKRKKSNGSVMEVERFDGDMAEDEDEDDEGIILPFEKMKEWFQNKPAGFGEGKEYDTSIEDKLVEEIEQSRRAQLANINKLKNNPIKPGSKKEDKLQKAPAVVPNGICVRLENLPKKKNVHRDLKLAFKGFPGLVDIIPAVSGTRKTRDPVCKGFAFVYLVSEEAAKRFVKIYSEQSIAFGKIQKQVTCEISNQVRSSVSPIHKSTPKLKLPIVEENLDKEIVVSLDSWVMTSTDESVSANWEVVEKGIEHLNLSEPHDDDNLRPSAVTKTDSVSPKKLQKSQKVKNKQIVEPKTDDDDDDNDNLRPSTLTKTDSISSNKQEKSHIVKKKLNVQLRADDEEDEDEDDEVGDHDDIISETWEKVEEGIEDLGLLEPHEEDEEEEEDEEDEDEEDEDEEDEDEVDDHDDIISDTWEKVEEGIEYLGLLEPHDEENLRPRTVANTDSLSSEQQRKSQKSKKKMTVKQKTGKVPKLHIPASARRLKVKDKSALVGALSRYGTPASLASRKEN